jgi:hypothetical protein
VNGLYVNFDPSTGGYMGPLCSIISPRFMVDGSEVEVRLTNLEFLTSTLMVGVVTGRR